MARTRLLQAVRDAVVEEMERDPKVIVYGEDVELSIVGDLRGVHKQFGPDRIRNTPISETSLTGMAVGLASSAMCLTASTSYPSARPPSGRRAVTSPWSPSGGC